MAIDRMVKVWLVGPASGAPSIPTHLARIGLLHVARVDAGDLEGSVVTRLTADTREVEARLRSLRDILEVVSEFAKTEADLLCSLIPTPIETTRAELRAALEAVDVEALPARVKDAAGRRAAARAALEQAQERLAALGAFRSVGVLVPRGESLRWTDATLWVAPAKPARRVLEEGAGPSDAVLEHVATLGGMSLVASVCLKEHAEAVASRLRSFGFQAVPAAAESTTLDGYVLAIEEQRTEEQKALDAAVADLKELGKLRRPVELVLGQWEEQLHTRQAVGQMVATGRAAVLLGYVRERELDVFRSAVARDLPQVSMVTEDPGAGDNVPVSLRNASVFRPAEFLVGLFGLPGYFAFDPSAYLMLSFVVFYGFCLGDALYGLVQLGLALALLRRYRAYPGLRSFFALLAWGGVSTILVGVLTRAWAGDLWKPEYLGAGNFLERLSDAFDVGDPMEKPLVVLGLALFMGVANQLWGITMKFYGCWRQGDRRGAIYDAGLWYFLLPGLVILVACFFSPTLPSWLPKVGGGLALVGAVGLVLTQGRHEKSLAGKIIVGLVSLYGIVGSYGCVSFIGDTLSYSRLLALALTTTIVGMAVNIMGKILSEMVGSGLLLSVVLFSLVAVPGHVFNLLISGLGAFIHSARLIFVEFFGRFYEPGAQRFAPLGATVGRIRVVD